MMKNRYKKTSGIVVSYWFCFIFYIASTPDGRFSLLRSCDHSVVGPSISRTGLLLRKTISWRLLFSPEGRVCCAFGSLYIAQTPLGLFLVTSLLRFLLAFWARLLSGRRAGLLLRKTTPWRVLHQPDGLV